MDNNDVDVAIIPPEPDELTNTENFGQNNLKGEVEDVAGTLVICSFKYESESCRDDKDWPLHQKARSTKI